MEGKPYELVPEDIAKALESKGVRARKSDDVIRSVPDNIWVKIPVSVGTVRRFLKAHNGWDIVVKAYQGDTYIKVVKRGD